MTGRWLKFMLVWLAGLSAAACSRPPNPVVAHDPIPEPPPGYRVVCSSSPTIFYGFSSACAPGQRPVLIEERTTVRVRG
jgi:hypothetical protein